MRVALALYRCLIYLLPREFRAQFGAAMEERFALRARRGSIAHQARFTLTAMLDVVSTAIVERTPFARHTTLAPPPEFSRTHIMSRLRNDLRFAVRALRARPAFSFAVIATLALGVGANIAVFMLVDAVILRPLPVKDSASVIGIFTTAADSADAGGYGLDDGLSYSSFRRLQDHAQSMTAVAGFIDVSVGFEARSDARQLTAGVVSGNYFDLLGVRAALGRLVMPSDDRLGAAEHIVVLSDALWAGAFGRDPAVVGQTVHIGGGPFVVVGVTPPAFRGTRLSSRPELWVPLTTVTDIRAGGIWNGPLGRRMLGDHPLAWVGTLGRLRSGVTRDAAADEINRLLPARREAPGSSRSESRIVVQPLDDAAALVDRRSLVRFLAILSTVVGLTLLIACMNVANLTWMRTAERARELAVRSALGAGRARLIWQLLLEYVLLAAIGGAAGLAIAVATVRLFSVFSLPGQIPVEAMHLRLGANAVLLSALLSSVAALLIGLRPALRASRPSSAELLRSHGASHGRASGRLLIVGQVALTVILLVAASLFLRSLRQGIRMDMGFEPRPLTAVSMDLFRYGYTSKSSEPYYRDALSRAAALPGARGVALASHVPLTTLGRMAFDGPGGAFTSERPLRAGLSVVSADYFRVMGIPLVEGRAFAETDVRISAPVSIINQSAARALFPDGTAIGREIRIHGAKSSVVVGVARDSKYMSVMDKGVPVVYLNFLQELPTGGTSVILQSSRPSGEATVAALRDVVQSVDPHVALYDARAVSEQIETALAPQRFGTVLLGLFAVVGLTVAAVGIYSLVGGTVAQRAPELGIRVALGASSRSVLRVVLRQAGIAIVAGLFLGLMIAVPVTKTLERFLIGVPPLDRWSFGAAVLLFAAGAVLAIIGPARRAIRTDPLLTLRGE